MLNVWLWEAKGCKRNPLLTSAYDSFPLETTKTSLSHHRDRDEETALNLWELRNKIKNILKRKLLMGPLTLRLTKLMQVCQWLLAASEHILHQSLPLTESLVPPACSHRRFGDPWPTPAPWGKTNGFLTILVLWIGNVNLLGISNFNKPWTSSDIFFKRYHVC